MDDLESFYGFLRKVHQYIGRIVPLFDQSRTNEKVLTSSIDY